MRSYWGAALREPEKNYSKYTFDDLNDGAIKTSIQGGWVAMLRVDGWSCHVRMIDHDMC